MIFSENYKFRNYSVLDGLSQNIVYAVNQDLRGFIWVCTQQGLNRFDGKEFVIYRNNPEDDKSIFNDLIYTSYLSKENILWFGSLDGGFFRYVPEDNNFRNFRIPVKSNLTQSKLLIFDFTEDNSGTLYIASFGAGLFKYYPESDTFSKEKIRIFNNEKLINATKLYHDREGILWIGTWDNGLFKYNIKNDELENFSKDAVSNNSLSNNRVRFIFKDSNDILWIGTSDGLNIYNPEDSSFSNPFSDINIELSNTDNIFRCINEDKNGNLWIGTHSSGLIIYNRKSNTFSKIDSNYVNNENLSGNLVNALFNDRTNVMWVGTYNDGLSKFDCDLKKFYSLKNIAADDKKNIKISVNAVYEDKEENLYIGTLGEGLFISDKRDMKLRSFTFKFQGHEMQKGQTVTCIYGDRQDNVYFGLLGKGLFFINKKTGKTENFNYPEVYSDNTVFSITDFDNDNIWLGTRYHGLLLFNKKRGTFKRYDELKKFKNKLTSNEIQAVLKDSSGSLWIGTYMGGLNKLDFEKGKITHYIHSPVNKNSISENYITSICEDSKGRIWIGTMNRGLNLYSVETDSFKKYSVKNGMNDDTIRAIVNDNEGNLWISTNNGITKFNPENETFRNYEYSDGLQSKEFNDRASFKSSGGTIYFGGITGLNFFKPDEIKDNKRIPEIVLTDFKIFNQSIINSAENPYLKKSIFETNEISLTYRESVISFEFASLVYNNVSKNRFAYKMDGFDRDWTYCGTRRFATYTSLEPGTYNFRVKGSNNDGIWNEEGTSVKIVISPPYWKTLWFKSLGVMSIIGMTGIAYTNKLNKIRSEKKSNEEFSRRLLDSQEKERKKIASGLHNTVAHDILITKNKAVLALKNVSEPEKMKEVLTQISDLASSTLNDVRSITYNLHPHQLERLGLTKAIKSIINNVEKSTEIKFTAYIENTDNIFPQDQEINIYRIIQECLNNIIKHSHANESYINISRKLKTLEILVSDNGIGISKDSIKGIGMNELNERIKLYNGILNIESEPGKGTLIKISIPIKNTDYESRKEN